MSRPLSRSSFLITDMVRTRGGSRVRPRVRFSTPERETAAPVPAPVPSPVPEAIPDEPLGFRRYQTRMGPRAPSQCLRGELGGPGLPSGPALRAQASSHLLDHRHHQSQQQLRRHLHLSYHRPRGLGGPCS